MADSKPTTNSYKLLGGVNTKASEYSTGKAQFLNLSNLDFQVPNALQKRPGSTQAIGLNASGPVNSLFEFIKLDGSSYVVAGTDTEMVYKTGTSLTTLEAGWTNGQPADMLTFVNKLWMTNGQNFRWWTGTTLLPAGLPMQKTVLQGGEFSASGGSFFLVGGATHLPLNTMYAGGSGIVRGAYVAYAYVRSDGYVGPADFLLNARNAVGDGIVTSGGEYFTVAGHSADYTRLYGFTIPSGFGISAVAVYLAVDTITSYGNTQFIPFSNNGNTSLSSRFVGDLGFLSRDIGSDWNASKTLIPSADTSRFYLYTLVPGSSLYLAYSGSGGTQWACDFIMNITQAPFVGYTAPATGNDGFSAMTFDFFTSYVPKYIDVNQNVMFYSGFSAAPSAMYFSNLGSPESVERENQFEVRTNDGDRIYAHRTYSNQTIVFKENSFHKIIGDTADNFQLVELSTEYGCISDKTIIEFKEKLLFLDKKGIVEFNGANWDIISTPVESIFQRMNLSAAKEKAVAVHQLFRNQVWFGIPIDNSTKNNITVVYDYLLNAWTFFEGFNPASFAMVKQQLNLPTVWRGDYSGMIYYHSASFYGDNGQGITCLGLTPFEKNQENETWIWRRIFIDVATATGLTGTIGGKVFSNYDEGTVQATFSMYQDAFQSRSEIGVVGKAAAMEFSHYSASLPLLINGYSWAKRFLRNV